MDIIKNIPINWLDLAILVLVIRCAYIGIKLGLTAELFKFIGTVLALILAVQWYSRIADVIVINFSMPIWLCEFLCFIAIAQLVRVIFKYGVAMLLKILNVQFMPQLERVGGGVLGFGRGIILSGILLLAMSFFPSDYIRDSIYNKSFSGFFLIRAVERTYTSLTFWLPEEQVETDIFETPTIVTKEKKK